MVIGGCIIVSYNARIAYFRKNEEGNKMLFTGRHEHQLDDKNRLRIPSKFKKGLTGELGDKPYYFFQAKNGCIGVMSEEVMNKTFAPLAKDGISDMSQIKRILFSSITPAEEDAQGRVVLPLSLRLIAGIKKDIITLGVGNYIEIWATERYVEYMSNIDFDTEFENLGI